MLFIKIKQIMETEKKWLRMITRFESSYQRWLYKIKPVNPKGNQSWIFIGKTDAEAETPILWPPDAKNWLIGKDLEAGKDWGQKKGTTEDKMIGWHHRLNRHEFVQILGAGVGQGGLVCYRPWGHKESDMGEWLNQTELNLAQVCIYLYLKYVCI